MAGLNLSGAVRNYQDGVRFKQQQDDAALMQKERDTMKMGDEAFAATIDSSKAEWAMSGAPGEYKPSDATMLKAAEARGTALAKAGSWKGYLQNETSVMPQRIRIRNNALAKYEEDGDFEALFKATHQTISDGKEVAAITKEGGMPALPSIGREATPPVYKVKFSDGVEKEVQPDKFLAGLKLMNSDPQKAAERELELNFKRAVAQVEGDKQKEVKRTEGDEARKTLATKYELDTKLEDVKFGQKKTLADADNASAEKRTNTSSGATVRAAEIGGDRRVEAAEVAAGTKGKPSAVKAKELSAMVIDHHGTPSPMGSGNIGNPRTAAILEGAQAYMEQYPEASVAQAMNEAAKRVPGGKGGK